MALSGYRNHGPRRRHRHVRISDWVGVVGCGRLAGRAVFYARLRGRTFAVAGIIPARRGTAGARYLQREIVRLAAARKPLYDDALHRRAETCGASGFAASGPRSLENAAWFVAAGGTRGPSARRVVHGVAEPERLFFCAHSAMLFLRPD